MRSLALAVLFFALAFPAVAELSQVSPTFLLPGPVATSALPTCSSATSGMYYLVNDALTPLIGSSLTGGGLVTVVVKCNATNWLVI